MFCTSITFLPLSALHEALDAQLQYFKSSVDTVSQMHTDAVDLCLFPAW